MLPPWLLIATIPSTFGGAPFFWVGILLLASGAANLGFEYLWWRRNRPEPSKTSYQWPGIVTGFMGLPCGAFLVRLPPIRSWAQPPERWELWAYGVVSGVAALVVLIRFARWTVDDRKGAASPGEARRTAS